MSKFTIKADPALYGIEEGVRLRLPQYEVLVPEALVSAVRPYALGNDAVAFAGFLASFPTAVSGSLGVTPGTVVDFAESLTQALERSGVDVSAIRRQPVARSYGARHPGLI